MTDPRGEAAGGGVRMSEREEWPDDVPLLHIVAQSYYHQPAFIAGNRAGLIALRNALDAALKQQATTAAAEVTANDGEGYGTYVRWLGTGEAARMPYGYTDTEMCPQSDQPWPKWMLYAR